MGCVGNFITIRTNPADVPNGGTGPTDNADTYCGNYLNPIQGSFTTGAVTGKF